MTACAVHSLIEVFRARNYDAPDAMTIVRWCTVCGVVVGDVDIDGRTAPGAVFKMKFPHPPSISAPQPPQAERVPTADMFWNHDDAERLYEGIGEFLNDEICNGTLEVGDIRTVQQAMRLPNVQIKITSIDDESCDAEYEVIEVNHGAKP